jgi:hypothetical protein
MRDTYIQELADLFTLGSGDREHSAAIAEQIAAGKIRLPPCFNVRNGTPEQTARAHELARLLTAN